VGKAIISIYTTYLSFICHFLRKSFELENFPGYKSLSLILILMCHSGPLKG
jgi:hypothetical protein